MKRNLTLDFIKGLCIIFIIIDHFTGWNNSIRLLALFPFWITMAVPMLMIVLGYLYAMSYQRHGINTIRKAYAFRQLLDKFIRYTIPFLMAYSIELFISSIDNGFKAIFPLWIRDFFTGGWGAGSYYYPILLQFMILFPILHFIIYSYDRVGLWICFVINVFYELFQWYFHISGPVYRLLIFRYTFLIAFGCYLLIGKKPLSVIEKVSSFIIGSFFIWLFSYSSYEPVIICNWTTTSFPTAFFVIPIAILFIQIELKNNIFSKTIAKIGCASYNIFLTQMVYFNYVAPRVNTVLHNLSSILICMLNLIICSTAGYIFYFVESKLTKRILLLIHQKETNAHA